MSKIIFSILLSLSLISCVSYRPILAPNDKFKATGEEIAEQDVDLCLVEAEKHLEKSKQRRAAKEGVRGLGIGAFFGALFGVLTGDSDSIVKGAAIGAGVGGALGAGGVMAEDKLTPDRIKQRYVAMCLNNKGYQILGWE